MDPRQGFPVLASAEKVLSAIKKEALRAFWERGVVLRGAAVVAGLGPVDQLFGSMR